MKLIDSANERKIILMNFYLNGMDCLKDFKLISGEYIKISNNKIITLLPCVDIAPSSIHLQYEEGIEMVDVDNIIDGIQVNVEFPNKISKIKSFQFIHYINYDEELKFFFNEDLIPIMDITQDSLKEIEIYKKLLQKDLSNYISLF